MMKAKKHSGMTLIELCISLTLISLVMVAGMQLLGITFKGVHDIDNEIRIEREDSTFAALVNENIQKSTVLFTIPKKSFVDDKLTDGWNYIGVMNNVNVPKSCSRTGKAIENSTALVYVEYLGKTQPSSLPYDCVLVHNDQGYFSKKIIGHSFTDSNGNFHDYSIIFKPQDPELDISQNITYEFTSDVTDKDGNKVGEGKGIDIDTMLHSLNTLSINYNGSIDNPAVAIAFKPNVMPAAYQQKNHAVNIILVLNMSSEMSYFLDNGRTVKRSEIAKNETIDLLSKLSSKLKDVNVIFVPYSTYGGYGPLYGIDEDDIKEQKKIKYLYNLNTDYEELKEQIEDLKVDGDNNGGDGFRVAYRQMKIAETKGLDLEANNYLIYVNGSLLDRLSVEEEYTDISKSPSWDDIYTGLDMIPPYFDSPNRQMGMEDHGRRYVKYWFDKINDDYDIEKSYFVNLFKDGDFGTGNQELDGYKGDFTIYRGGDYAFLREIFDLRFNISDIEQFNESFEFIGNDIIELVDSVGGPIL